MGPPLEGGVVGFRGAGLTTPHPSSAMATICRCASLAEGCVITIFNPAALPKAQLCLWESGVYN